MRHGHGDDGHRFSRPVRVDFSSNVRPGGPSAGLLAHLAERLGRIGRYPEPAAESLAEKLAARAGVRPENILVTSGAVGALHLVAQARRGARSRIAVPAFAEYEDAAALNGHAPVFVTREALFVDGPAAGELVWLCNPNNPTGVVTPRAELLAFVDRHPDCVFVLDLSYADFAAAAPVTVADAAARANLLVVHSLTKTFAIPGLRLGFLGGAGTLVAAVARFAAPWAVNALAVEAGLHLLRPGGDAAAELAEHRAEAERWRAELATIPGLRPQASATPFFLVELGRGTAAELKRRLMERHGFLIRDAANFRGLTARHFRLAAQGRAADDELTEALRAWTSPT